MAAKNLGETTAFVDSSSDTTADQSSGDEHHIPPQPPHPQPQETIPNLSAAWKNALDEAKAELGTKSYALIAVVADYDACLAALETKSQKLSKRSSKFMKIFTACTLALQVFDKAISACCSSNPEIAGFIWGGMQALLIVVGKYQACGQLITEMLDMMTSSMPTIETYLYLFPTSDRLQKHLVSVYKLFAMFCARAFKFLNAIKFVLAAKYFFKCKWLPLEEFLNSTANSMEKEIKYIVRIAGVLHMEASKKRAEDTVVVLDMHHKETGVVLDTHHEEILAVLGMNHEETIGRLEEIAVGIQTGPRRDLDKPIVIVPYFNNENFVGRRTELSSLHHEFSTALHAHSQQVSDLQGTRAAASPCVMAIYGQGGVGKTQLALKLLFDNMSDYCCRFWIRAEKEEIIQQDFATVGQRLATEMAEEPIKDLDIAVKKAREWLETTKKKWLLVLDNVDDAATVQSYLPKVGHGSIVVTTRKHTTADAFGQSSRNIDLQGMDNPTAIQLLRKLVPDIVDEKFSEDSENYVVVGEILNEIDGLPLCIYQMGSYIRQKRVSLWRFQKILQTESDHLYSDKSSVTSPFYNHTVAACCNLSINLLSEKDRYLFGVLSVFQTDEIPKELITKNCNSSGRLRHLAQERCWEDAIFSLKNNSLMTTPVRYNQSASSTGTDRAQILSIHRVLKRHALHLLSDDWEGLANTFADASALIYAMFPKRSPCGISMTEVWHDCETWLPHVIDLKASLKTIEDSQRARGSVSERRSLSPSRAYAEVLCNCSWYMWERGIKGDLEFAFSALEVCQEVIQNASKDSESNAPGGDNTDGTMIFDSLLADMHTIIGGIQLAEYQLGHESCFNFEAALRLLQGSADEKARQNQPLTVSEKRLVANAYNNAAMGHFNVWELDDAAYLLAKAEAAKREFGNEETHPIDFAFACYNSYRLNFRRGRFDDAFDDCRRALEITTCPEYAEDFRILQFQCSYANLVAMKDLEKGLQLQEKLLAVRLRVLGPTHADTAVSYYGLSWIYQDLRRLVEALDSIKRCILILLQSSNTNGRLARAYFRQSLIYEDAGLPEEADVARSEARHYRKIVVGDSEELVDDTMKDYDMLDHNP